MDNTSHETDVLIIGAGLCGLTTAYELEQHHLKVTVIEESDTVGGVIQSESVEGYLIERGPHTFQNTGNAIIDLCQRLQLTPQPASDVSHDRFVFSQGKLNPVPSSPLGFLASNLLSFNAKIHVLSEPFIKPLDKQDDISIADFTRHRLGNEVLTQMVTPFLSGVYAGDPEQLSAQAVFPKLIEWERDAGSIVKGALKAKKNAGKKEKKLPYALMNFENGMHTLPEALSSHLKQPVLLNHTVKSIQHNDSKVSCTVIDLHQEEKTYQARHIIFATPAYVTAELTQSINSLLSKALQKIDYAPIATCQLGIEENSLKHPINGFGFLVPRTTTFDLLGTIFTSQLFPNRAPKGTQLLSCFTGGALNPDIVAWSDDTLTHEMVKELKVILKEPDLNVSFSKVYRWQKAIPQYVIGHTHTVAQIKEALTASPHLSVTGNYIKGVSLNDCVINAQNTAKAIVEKLNQPQPIAVD